MLRRGCTDVATCPTRPGCAASTYREAIARLYAQSTPNKGFAFCGAAGLPDNAIRPPRLTLAITGSASTGSCG
jgi:hypothetical protein